jgi:predicted lipoprotein with Yx(FWY)xxD motif
LRPSQEDVVISKKWGIAAVGGVLAALALTGCAPRSTDSGYTTDAGAPVDGANDAPSAAPSAPPSPLTPVKLTEQLNAKTIKKMGKVVTDQNGWVLYRFDSDTAKPSKSNCEAKCAKIWPPAVTDGNPVLNGVDASLVGTVTRADGSMQITLNGWPLYRYIGDKAPGQWKGQNVGAKWFVSAPDGKKNLTCLPTPPPKAVEPPADDSTGDTNTGTSNTGNNSNSNSNDSGDYGSGGY